MIQKYLKQILFVLYPASILFNNQLYVKPPFPSKVNVNK